MSAVATVAAAVTTIERVSSCMGKIIAKHKKKRRKPMTEMNETMRAALREIESRAATALANQPGESDECGMHLNKALAGIELAAHVALWGQEGYPPPRRAD